MCRMLQTVSTISVPGVHGKERCPVAKSTGEDDGRVPSLFATLAQAQKKIQDVRLVRPGKSTREVVTWK